jgi:two-component system, NarL family, sensor kinase
VTRRIPLITSMVLLLAGLAYAVMWAGRPGDCTAIDVRPESWRSDGVVIDAIQACSLSTGDLVTEVDGDSLTSAAAADAAAADDTPLDYTIVRDGDVRTVRVQLTNPNLVGRLVPAWSTVLFVVSLLVLSAYVAWRRRDAATRFLLILASGLAASTIPTLLGLPVVGLLRPTQYWLHILLTQVAYIAAWTAGLAFGLIFPRSYGPSNRWFRAALVLAPMWALAGWAAISTVGSSNLLQWTGRLIAGGAVIVALTQLAIVVVSVLQLRRAADAVERQQMRWLAGATVLAISAGLAGWLLPEILLGEGLPTGWIGLAALPFVVGLGVSVLRYRLFDLDVVLNRGLVYGLLTLSVAMLYMVVVTAVAALLRGSSTTPAAIVATAAVAVTINPLRVVLQRAVDRLMYGDRRDPYSALSRLGRRLDDAGDGNSLLNAVAADIADALRIPYVAVELDPSPRVEAGRRPRWLTDDQLVDWPLVDRGERIGRLQVAPRTPSEPLSRADRRLLDDLARRVGAAARELGLRQDLQRSRERLVLAREEERRRLRRALHDEVGPAIAGLGLRTEAARRLVETDPHGAEDALVVVRDGTQILVDDIRRLAYNLRPPALDELGLAGALQQHAGTVSSPNVSVTTTALGELPAAVEAAAYRIAIEAVANVVRHASASACTVRVSAEDGHLQIRVADDGHGMPPDVHAGVGMSSMRERAAELGGSLRVESRAGGGTIVTASLPIGEDAT